MFRLVLARSRASFRRALLAGAVTTSIVAAGALTAAPARADAATVASKADLDARLHDAASGVAVTLQLGQDLLAADADHDVLTTPEGSVVTLDLHGQRLQLQRLTVGTGAELTVTDSTGAASGAALQVGATSSSARTPTGIAVGSAATLRVSGTTVSASGSDTGTTAGIGSPAEVTSAPGALSLTAGAIVRGQGGKGGAGIGGAQGAAAIAVSVVDSTLVGRGGLGGAGIGSGRDGVSFGGLTSSSSVTTPRDEGDYSRYSSSIDGSGGRGAAGIGGGLHASGGPVDLNGNTDANVSTDGPVTSASGTPSVVGAGQAPTAASGTFGTLHVGRYAWLWANDSADALIVPADGVVENDGAIRAVGGATGDGTIRNQGLVSATPSTAASTTGPDDGALITVKVTGHDYALRLDPNGGTATGAQVVRVFCAHIDATTLPVPTAPQAGRSLMGWNTRADGRGEDLAGQSLEELTGEESADGTPVPLDLHARYGVTPHPTGDALPAAALGRSYDEPLPIAGDGITGYWVATTDRSGSSIPGLPAGLGLDGRTGHVQGTPTEAGTFHVRILTAGRYPVDAEVAITVAGPPVIAAGALPTAQQGVAYTTALSATGDGTLGWSVVGGALPQGLSLDAAGVLSGTPEASGTSTFTLRATTEFGSADQTFRLAVTAPVPAPPAPPASSPSTASPSAAPSAAPSADPAPAAAPAVAAPVLPITQRIAARFGHRLDLSVAASSTAPVVYGLRGELPTGVVLDTHSGLISGVPARSGTFRVTITAASAGGTATTAVVLVVPAVEQLIGVERPGATWIGGHRMPVAVTGVRKGERFRILLDGRTVKTGTVARSGTLHTSIAMRSATRDRMHRIEVATSRRITDPATTATASFRITVLASKKALKVTVQQAHGTRWIVVERLAAHERVVARVRGAVVAEGRADAEGTFTFARSKAGRGTRTVVVTGTSAERQGTVRVANPRG